jgi:hypothetical protein
VYFLLNFEFNKTLSGSCNLCRLWVLFDKPLHDTFVTQYELSETLDHA